jgi:crotonobetainyl-CoA:carnitine CoA-transferase CaiB-like acyl-CoA transferase
MSDGEAPTAAPGAPEPALAGVRVVELGGGVAAPFCARLLGDQGAEVVKVERPGRGDPSRDCAPFATGRPHRDTGALFLALNTGKASVTLDLATATGREIALELVRRADVVVSGWRPSTAERIGLDDAALAKANDRAVRVAVTNFGLHGPLRDARASELVLCAASGLAYLTGEYDDPPTKLALNQCQYMGGAHAAVGALAALWHTEATGEGQCVEVSLQEVLAGLLQGKLSFYSYMGCVHRRQPRGRGGLQYALMPCADGWIAPMFVPGANVDWELFAAFLDVPELLDERFATRAGRLQHAAELDRLLVGRLAERGKFDWFHSAQEWRLTFGVAQTPEELLACPQLEARGFWQEQHHPVAGTLRMPARLFHSTEDPQLPARPAPRLGEHTAAVLGELGITTAETAALRAAAVA